MMQWFFLEWRLLRRDSSMCFYPLIYFTMLLFLFPIAFTTNTEFLQKIAPGSVWVSALLACILSASHFFDSEKRDGFLDQCRVSPLPLANWVFAKFLAFWLMQIGPILCLSALTMLLFHLPFKEFAVLCVTLILGTPIILLLSMLASALTLHLPAQGILIGLIIFPWIVPVIIFAIHTVLRSGIPEALTSGLAFLGGLSLLAVALLPGLIAAALKMD